MDNKLSMNRFKDRDPETFTDEEKRDYIFSRLLHKSIEVLETSIPSERQFKRARFTIMALIWEAYDTLTGPKE